MKVPKSLQNWFFIHFIVDLLFGLPLFFAPTYFLSLFGLQAEPYTARILGAAVVGIGTTTYFMTKDIKSFKSALDRKIAWSLSAMLAVLITLFEGGSSVGLIILAIFAIFSITWIYYRRKLK